MAAYSSVFKRVEKKYRIGAAERAFVEAAAGGPMAVDSHYELVPGHSGALHDRPIGGKAAL